MPETAPAHAETENIDFLKKSITQISMILVDCLYSNFTEFVVCHLLMTPSLFSHQRLLIFKFFSHYYSVISTLDTPVNHSVQEERVPFIHQK